MNLEKAKNPEIQIKSELTFYTREATSEEDGEYENIDTEDNDEVAAYYVHGKYLRNPRFRQH